MYTRNQEKLQVHENSKIRNPFNSFLLKWENSLKIGETQSTKAAEVNIRFA